MQYISTLTSKPRHKISNCGFGKLMKARLFDLVTFDFYKRKSPSKMKVKCLNYLRVKNFKNMFSNIVWNNTGVCFRYFKRRKWDFLVWKPFTALKIKESIKSTQLNFFYWGKIFINKSIFSRGFFRFFKKT